MKKTLEYNKRTKTIDQMPDGIMVAYFNGTRWICEPNYDADDELCRIVFDVTRREENRYERSGAVLMNTISSHVSANTMSTDFIHASYVCSEELALEILGHAMEFDNMREAVEMLAYTECQELGLKDKSQFNTIDELKQSAINGDNVKWRSDAYNLIFDIKGQFLIECQAKGHCQSLLWADGVTSDYDLNDFYIQ